jgi:hypothetical protein
MKKTLPAMITVLLIAGALVLLTQRDQLSNLQWSLTSGGAPAASPEEIIWRMSDAARAGDVRAYLDCFSGALRQRLEKTAREMGEAQFSRYLNRLNEEVTGIAVSDLEQPDQHTAWLRVEFVFRGRSETQKHHFTRIDGQWKIDAVDDAERANVLIPYGTKVTEKE